MSSSAGLTKVTRGEGRETPLLVEPTHYTCVFLSVYVSLVFSSKAKDRTSQDLPSFITSVILLELKMFLSCKQDSDACGRCSDLPLTESDNTFKSQFVLRNKSTSGK